MNHSRNDSDGFVRWMTMNLLFAINRQFVGLLGSCLRSVVRNGGAVHYHAYVLHSDLTELDRAAVRSAAGAGVSLHFIAVDEGIFEDFPESSRYPKQIYYRLAAPLLLPEGLDRILYLDVDLVVINSLAAFYDTDFEGHCYIACSHVKSFLTRVNQLRLGTRENVPYINTGVMLLNLSALRENLTMERLRETARKKKRAFLLPDQDLLTVMYGGRIKLVDTMRYNLSDRILRLYNANPRNKSRDLDWVRENAVIIHYYGKNKPWKGDYRGILDVFYKENLENMP